MPGQIAKPENAIRDLLDRSKGQIALALPKHLTPERMVRVAMTTVLKTPQLLECSPLSIVACVIQASELGLELSGPLGHAYLVPYFNKHTKQKEAQFQIGYRGLIDLAYRSGKVITFCSRVVYKNDKFRFAYGTEASIAHEPTLDDPGEPIAVYAVVKTKDGGVDFEVMSKTQIDAHRQRYSKQTSDYSPWVTAWEEMAKKTPMRRLAKRVPLSVELVSAAVADEYGEVGAIGDVVNVSAPERITEKLNGSADKDSVQPEPESKKIIPATDEETKRKELIAQIRIESQRQGLSQDELSGGPEPSSVRDDF
jgi:recombination protein RecT